MPHTILSQKGLDVFQSLSPEEQAKVWQQIHPLPGDPGRKTAFDAPFANVVMEQVVSDQVKNVKHVFADFALAKAEWTYDSLINSIPRQIREYHYNKSGQLTKIESYGPRKRMNFVAQQKKYPPQDSFHYDKDKLVFHRHMRTSYFYQHAPDRFTLKKIDRKKIETLERHHRLDGEITAFVMYQDQAEKPKHIFRYQGDTLQYSMLWQPTRAIESHYSYNNQHQLSDWIKTFQNYNDGNLIFSETVNYSRVYNDFGGLVKYQAWSEGQSSPYEDYQMHYAFERDKEDRLHVIMYRERTLHSGEVPKFEWVCRYIFDHHYNWVFKSIKHLTHDHYDFLQARLIEY